MKKYDSEEEILNVVRSFEDTTISRNEWKHAEHLTVALYYVTNYSLDAAHEKMRGGIFKLLKSFGIDLTKEMPYHETLTVFWLRTVAAHSDGDTLPEKANSLIANYDKDYPLRYYSRELLFSDAARESFIEPDLKPLVP